MRGSPLLSGGLIQRLEKVAALQKVGATQYWHVDLTVVSCEFWQEIGFKCWADEPVGHGCKEKNKRQLITRASSGW